MKHQGCLTKNLARCCAGIAIVVAATAAPAQDTTTFLEQGQLIRASRNIASPGPDLMGDRVNLYTGALEFVQTDVSLPGNDALQVQVGRRYVASAGRQGNYDGLFGDWDLDIPHLHGIFNGYGRAVPQGWNVSGDSPPSYSSLNRCTGFGAPAEIHNPNNFWYADEFWGGNFLYVPGEGDQKMLLRDSANTIAPTDGAAYPVVTRSGWQLSCIAGLQSPFTREGTQPSGEGFMAVSPAGVRMRFDWIVTRGYQGTVGEQGLIQRQEVWILPTRVTDRFGNAVTYTYDTTDPWKLLSIAASDGRTLTFGYGNASHRVASVSDGTRTWSYLYPGSGSATTSLSQVVLPDASAWSFDLREQNWNPSFDPMPGCSEPGRLDPRTQVSTMTHPSGATASFSLSFVARGRLSGRSGGSPCAVNASYGSLTYATRSLTAKTLSGPGIASSTWSYAWSAAVDELDCGSNCDPTQTLLLTDPRGFVTRYVHGTVVASTEGQLLRRDDGWDGQNALRSTAMSYRASGAGPYPTRAGDSGSASGDDWMETAYLPLDTRTIYQQGASFTRHYTGFDTLARPTGLDRSSSLGYASTEVTAYADNPALWVMGQAASRSVDGIVVASTAFDGSTALPSATSSFGKLQSSYAFYADGTLQSLTDGAGHPTTYSAYKRGLAQAIAYADGTGQQATVNDIGLVTSLTNEAGTTTGYGYDALGRLAHIGPPGGDPVAWNGTDIAFQQIGASEYGLPAGHWRQVVSTGNAVTAHYFDALLRPQITTTYDAGNPGSTQSTTLARFDADGRTVFTSYPSRSIGSVGDTPAGTAVAYDALGRATQTQADSELGTLAATTRYLDGFQKQTTDPRGYATTYAYQAFDDPDEATIVGIAAPEGLNVAIARDVFGKPLSIARSGSWGGTSVSATRRYVYDAAQRLCKTLDPETGASVQALDAADNLAWRAVGLNLGDPGACNQGDVGDAAKVAYAYDARNRLVGTGFGDGSASIGRSYTADGLVASILSNGTTWTYEYNNRRLLRSQTLRIPGGGVSWGMYPAYDANGHVAALTYPDATTVVYSPNALGEATQVSGYASGVQYHPNGAVAGYTLANGIVHTLSQNVRGLPAQNRDAGVLQDQYAYDASGNVASIADQQEGIGSRSMAYDGLDRLTAADASGVWGAARYGYDPLDNLRTSVVGGRSASHAYDATNRLASIATDASVTGYGYDAHGNVTRRGSAGYAFDLGNRMLSANGVASYVYDGLGRRAVELGSDGTRYYGYDLDGKLLTSQDAGGTTLYVYLGGKPIGQTHSATGRTFLHTDTLGSPVATTDASGTIVGRTRYEPYGKTAAGTDPRGIGFTGQLNDPDTGLVYMQQRYYDPIAGRFLSVDPVTTDAATGAGFNLYGYAKDNPYRFTDPDGRKEGQAYSIPSEDAVVELQRVEVKAKKLSPLLGMADEFIFGGFGALSWESYRSGNNWTAAGYAVAGVGVAAITFGSPELRLLGAAKGMTPLFRAVGPAELADIKATGALRNLGSAEGKYFTTSAAEASAYAKQAVKAFGDQPYTIIRTDVPNSIFRGLSPATVDRGIPAWVISTDRLPGLVPNVMNHSPLPPLGF